MIHKQLIRRMVEIDRKYTHGHLTSSLSALPIIKKIYDDFNFKNDVFILSKGHAATALYAVLESHGFCPNCSCSQATRDIKNGIYCTTGSLGHGLPIATGIAIAKTIKKEPGKVYVLLGDGECQEGTFWETINIIEEFKIKNLHIIIDMNLYQGNKKVSHILKSNIIFIIQNCPNCSVINNIKGYGISCLASRPWLHTFKMSDSDYEQVLKEIEEL